MLNKNNLRIATTVASKYMTNNIMKTILTVASSNITYNLYSIVKNPLLITKYWMLLVFNTYKFIINNDKFMKNIDASVVKQLRNVFSKSDKIYLYISHAETSEDLEQIDEMLDVINNKFVELNIPDTICENMCEYFKQYKIAYEDGIFFTCKILGLPLVDKSGKTVKYSYWNKHRDVIEVGSDGVITIETPANQKKSIKYSNHIPSIPG